ncbi:hypothetical protein [Actinokineospora globicatena]|uniref:hypothetical protein n=1 Tax=Actinokineospora globicatena TaxID=103729 RepID=UPI0020A3A6F3|nr:hypothetical protein [Actinokineospora globicatena]MCP2303705.1 hypothetical protein [Actinokineospora globicatena]GLW79156.1 hypothetical protein Aglo01_36380 [Actinokineospora globicatena]GLW86434.1 hypothetical protein Aglo02_40730 [Actinokineospora globicatena]
MKTAILSKAAAALLSVAALWLSVTTAPPATAAPSCSVNDSRSVPGGYLVDLRCGSNTHTAVGTTLNEAYNEAAALGQLAAATGNACSYTRHNAIPGGYIVDISCTGGYYHTAAGTTLTDATTETRALAQLAAGTGKHCAQSRHNPIPGGYVLELQCTGGYYYPAAGTTLTDATTESRALAQLAANTGKHCGYTRHNPIPGGYSAEISCTGGYYHTGVGGTLTEAFRRARSMA